MCNECGCIGPEATQKNHQHDNSHHHHQHHHHHDEKGHTKGDKGHAMSNNETLISLNTNIMDKNDKLAQQNRLFFKEKNLFVINLISSPGSGKTTLIEKLANHFGNEMMVIEGDIQTRRDAERVIRAGSSAYQIETNGACHLDAHCIMHALEHLDLTKVKLLVIENVGNLVCPATYDLGEDEKVAILSTPEGDDKILKYPAIFSRISSLIINKIDVVDHFDFNINSAVNECKSLNPDFNHFNISAKTNEGIESFISYLNSKLHQPN